MLEVAHSGRGEKRGDVARQPAFTDIHADHGSVYERQRSQRDFDVFRDERSQSGRVEEYISGRKPLIGRQAHERPSSRPSAAEIVEVRASDRRHRAVWVQPAVLRSFDIGARNDLAGACSSRLQIYRQQILYPPSAR